ncbi:MAG: MBL fold metallo-hydrolase [Planctomycetes bacterium]|nr:MBL fold metallo-hydrolase [Planctomycetota bacterium]
MYEWRQLCPEVFLFRDPLSNVYVLRDNVFGIVIEAGSGAVFDRLAEIGVKRADMVLLTHHHRDVATGIHRCGQATVMVPEGEARYISDAETFWKTWKIYVRYDLTGETNALTRNREAECLLPGRVIEWRNWKIECIHLPGHTPYSFGYVARTENAEPIVFCGDLLTGAGGTTYTVHDLHWDYMPPPAGITPAIEGALPAIRDTGAGMLCPSHGEPTEEVIQAANKLEQNMTRLAEHLSPNRKPREEQTPHEILPHLVYLGGTSYLIISESGKGLVYDWGYMDWSVLERARAEWGCEEIEVVSFSHYHEDHVARTNELFYSTERSYWHRRPEVWVHRVLADVLANPTAYNLPCLWPVPIHPDVVVETGDRIRWHEYLIEFFHLPGQTYYHQGMVVDIDDKRCFFCGDSMWRPGDSERPPNAPVIPRNIYLPGHGYPYIAELYDRYDPQLLVPSHYEPFEATDELIEGFKKWAEGIAPRIVSLAGEERAGIAMNPHWIQTYPYRTETAAGSEIKIETRVCNPYGKKKHFRFALQTEEQWQESLLYGPPHDAPGAVIAPGERATAAFSVKTRNKPGREVLIAEAWVDGLPAGGPAEALIDAR